MSHADNSINCPLIARAILSPVVVRDSLKKAPNLSNSRRG